jgi:hypothetical protein
MKQALNYALEAGELLIQQKEQIGHGNFLVWLKANVPFSDRTARRYIRLCEYSDKLASVSDLQEAYRQVETLEAQEKKRKEQENKEKILAFKKTGEKPSTWDRSTDYQLKKQDDEEAYQRRKEEAFKPKEYSNPRITQEEINEALNITDRLSKQLDQDHRLNLSSYADNLTQQKMFGEIEHYINSFKTVSSQLEATHNLIKKIKLIANDLQRHTYEAVNH